MGRKIEIEVEGSPEIFLPHISPEKLAKIVNYIYEKGVAIEGRKFLSLEGVGKSDSNGNNTDVRIRIEEYEFREAIDYTLEVTNGLMKIILGREEKQI